MNPLLIIALTMFEQPPAFASVQPPIFAPVVSVQPTSTKPPFEEDDVIIDKGLDPWEKHGTLRDDSLDYPSWTWPGDILEHLEGEHGVDIGTMSRADAIRLHNRLHNAEVRGLNTVNSSWPTDATHRQMYQRSDGSTYYQYTNRPRLFRPESRLSRPVLRRGLFRGGACLGGS